MYFIYLLYIGSFDDRKIFLCLICIYLVYIMFNRILDEFLIFYINKLYYLFNNDRFNSIVILENIGIFVCNIVLSY